LTKGKKYAILIIVVHYNVLYNRLGYENITLLYCLFFRSHPCDQKTIHPDYLHIALNG